MTKSTPVPAAEFTRNFGHYRMLAQKGAVPVTSHGRVTGYFVPPDEYEEFERFRARPRSFATVELPEDKVAPSPRRAWTPAMTSSTPCSIRNSASGASNARTRTCA